MSNILIVAIYAAIVQTVVAGPPLAHKTAVEESKVAKPERVSLDVDPTGETGSFIQSSANPKQALLLPYRQEVNGSTPTGYISVGTPPKQIMMIFDTGSDVLLAKTWSTIEKEVYSIDAGIQGLVQPAKSIYDSNSSSTYEVAMDKHGRPAKGFIQYGSGMASTKEGRDNVQIGDNIVLQNFSIAEIVQDTLAMLHDASGTSGVLGLQHMKNRSYGESLFTRARDSGYMTAVGYCCNADMTGGTFLWSDTSGEGTAVPVVGQIHWAVPLWNVTLLGGNVNFSAVAAPVTIEAVESKGKEAVVDKAHAKPAKSNSKPMPVDSALESAADDNAEIAILIAGAAGAAGKAFDALLESFAGTKVDQLPVDPVGADLTPVTFPLCPPGGCSVVIDTGSNIIAMPQNVLSAMNKLLQVSPDCSNLADLPTLNLKLGEVDVNLPPESYVMKIIMPSMDSMDEKDGGMDGGMMGLDSVEAAQLKEVSPHATMAEGAVTMEDELRMVAKVDRYLAIIKRKYHLDIKEALKHVQNPVDQLLNSSTFCMSSFVALDADTKVGQLWILGTPLFNQYYTRWSWDPKDESPKLFLQPIAESHTCNPALNNDSPASSDKTGSSGGGGEGGGGTPTMVVLEEGVKETVKAKKIIRSEGKSEVKETKEEQKKTARKAAMKIRELHPHEIRFPHWAVGIKEV